MPNCCGWPVVPLSKILGRYLATRATTCGALAHVLDSFGALQIAEIPVYGTPFVNQTLERARIRQQTGLAVVGLWERGHLRFPVRDTVLDPEALMILARTREQLNLLEKLAGEQPEDELVFILGHGRIGCAAANFLERIPVPFLLFDQQSNPDCTAHIPVIGEAAGRQLLKQAGIEGASGAIITTNDDSNVEQLDAAGADFVVSNASVGASR